MPGQQQIGRIEHVQNYCGNTQLAVTLLDSRLRRNDKFSGCLDDTMLACFQQERETRIPFPSQGEGWVKAGGSRPRQTRQ